MIDMKNWLVEGKIPLGEFELPKNDVLTDQEDDDNCSVSSTDSEVVYGQQLNDDDLFWSVWSNSLFLLGGMGYVAMALWDVLKPDPVVEEIINDDDEIPEPSDPIVYSILGIGAPVVYFFNSLIDIAWALSIRRRNRKKRQMRLERAAMEKEREKENENENEKRTGNETSAPVTKKKKSKNRIMGRLRKHAAHRRELLAALWFGFAAVCAVIDVFVYERTSIYDTLSVHAYVLSAIFALTGRRTRPWTFSFNMYNVDSLEDLGDIFFLIGSCTDMILCDMSFDDTEKWWPVLSSALWFADACFYLRSDFLTATVVQHQSAFVKTRYIEIV